MTKGRRFAYLAFAIALAFTTGLWLAAKPSVSLVAADPLRSLAQLAGLFGVVALSANFLLSSRPLFLDKLLGGLDKVYVLHRHTGSLAFALMLSHPLLLIIPLLPGWAAVKFYLYPHAGLLELNLGILGLWGFIVLILLTVAAKLPYHIWKRTHQFMGLPFALVALHVLLIDSDVSRFLPLRIWMASLLFAGLGLYVYKVFLYRWLGPRFAYAVSAVRTLGAVTELTLKADGKRMAFRPGQFVFLSLEGEIPGPEEHPYTISSSPDDEELRLSIKTSGDHTARISKTKVGSKAIIHGPYGRFGEKFLENGKDSVWIAGGIGVTPFLSLMRYSARHEPKGNVTLFYSAKTEGEMVYKDELKKAAAKAEGIDLVTHASETEGYLTAERVEKDAGGLKGKRVFLCGPPPMMHALSKAFQALGIPARDIIFEDFSLR